MEQVFQIVSVTLQIVTLGFLVWLYRRTRLGPVLYNLIWQSATAILGWLQLWSHVAPTYFIAWSVVSRVTSTALFVWMVLSVLSLSRKAAPPTAA